MDARSQRVDSLPLPPGLLAQATTRPIAVTLVLPVLDAEKSLARIVRAADDALACATADYEILLVDGGSSDATLDVAAATAAVFPALRVLRRRRRIRRAIGAPAFRRPARNTSRWPN